MQQLPQFDPTKPFYPFIMTFYATVRGLIELSDKPTSDLAPLKLEAFTSQPLELDWKQLDTAFYKKTNTSIINLLETALRSLIITCYETSVQHYQQTDPEWRFFRFVRSAAAHDGRFYLQKRNGTFPVSNENPSAWSTRQIHMFMDSDPLLIKDGDIEPFLKPGDVLQFLYDIEQKF